MEVKETNHLYDDDTSQPSKVHRVSLTEVGLLFCTLEALNVFQYGCGFQTAQSLSHTSLCVHSNFRAFADVSSPTSPSFYFFPHHICPPGKSFCQFSFLAFLHTHGLPLPRDFLRRVSLTP